MSCNLVKEKIIQLTALYKQYESTVDDLQSSIFNYLNELNQELKLDFITFERSRKYIEDKENIFNFLKRAGFDFEIACKALENNLRWRIENKVDNISINDIHPSLLEIGLFYFHKTDKFNRPCAILNLREYTKKDQPIKKNSNQQQNDDDYMLLPPVTIDDVKKFIIFNVEICRRLLLDKRNSSSKKDSMILQYVMLLDLKGAGVSTLDKELVPFAVDLARHHFPGYIGSIFVLNYGWMYAGIWQLFKRILPEESLSRIFFPSSNKELLDYFDEDDLLLEHGGNDDYQYNLNNYDIYQLYGKPSSVLSMPKALYRVTSFDSSHEVFFTPYSTPYSSRPPTPNNNDNNNLSPVINIRPSFKHRSSSSSRSPSRSSSRPSSRPPSRPTSPGIINHHYNNHINHIDITNNNNNNNTINNNNVNSNNNHVPNWLKMTPKSPRVIPLQPLTPPTNTNNNGIVSPKPIKPILTNHLSNGNHHNNSNINNSINNNNNNHSDLHVNFQIDYLSHNRHLYNNSNNDQYEDNEEDDEEERDGGQDISSSSILNHEISTSLVSSPTNTKNLSSYSNSPISTTVATATTGLSIPKSRLYKLTRIHKNLKIYFERLLYRFISRRVTGVLYYMVMFVVFRGGLFNEFWKVITQNAFST